MQCGINMIFPKKLREGDKIGLVCPSSKIKAEDVIKCKESVEKLGFEPVFAKNINDAYAGYMAGDEKTRAYWINKMFEDDEIDGIFCIRGGDGSSRIMQYLDYDLISKKPKVFVGYSDVTNLLNAFSKDCGFVTYHGPMVLSNMIDFNDFSKESLLSMVKETNQDEILNFKNADYAIEILRYGKAEGRLSGGNLSLLSASVGTPYEFESKNRIIFIEEVGEPLSKIDKWIYHLRNSGKFDECAGVVLGQFIEITNPDDETFGAIESIGDALRNFDFPVVYNIQAGHGKPNLTLPIGATCTIDTKSKEILTFKC